LRSIGKRDDKLGRTVIGIGELSRYFSGLTPFNQNMARMSENTFVIVRDLALVCNGMIIAFKCATIDFILGEISAISFGRSKAFA